MRRMLVLLLVAMFAGDVSAQPAECPAAVQQAIERAVLERMGEAFQVRLADLSCRLTGETPAIEARPVPGARLGRPVRFAMFDGAGDRVGGAVATVFVTGPIVQAARAIDRGSLLSAEDVAPVTAEVEDVLMVRLPDRETAIGAVAVRDLASGEILTSTLLRVPPAVRSGDLVTTIARIGGVRVESKAVAAERGELGEMIRLVNPVSRRNLRGLVIGIRRVEVLREP